MYIYISWNPLGLFVCGNTQLLIKSYSSAQQRKADMIEMPINNCRVLQLRCASSCRNREFKTYTTGRLVIFSTFHPYIHTHFKINLFIYYITDTCIMVFCFSIRVALTLLYYYIIQRHKCTHRSGCQELKMENGGSLF